MPQKIKKEVHSGGIVHNGAMVASFVESSRTKLMYKLNNWLFDYLHKTGHHIENLPPLDDWTHSQEQESYWSINFPSTEWNVWIQAETVEFVNASV